MLPTISISFIVALFFLVLAIILIAMGAIIVPQKYVYIVERLGKFHKELHAGFHVIVPIIDKIAYKRSLKEIVLDVRRQECITADNIVVGIDGVLYYQVLDAPRSCYGIESYKLAAVQLAQTSLRSAVGKLELDELFEARENLNAQVVAALDEASENWGIKVLRYEVKDIDPPASVKDAMEKQMRAERERRAMIAESEGKKQSAINIAEGQKQSSILKAQGEAEAIKAVAEATAEGIRAVAESINDDGGIEATQLKVAEKYIEQFGKLAKTNNTMIIPSNLTDIAGTVATAMSVIKKGDLA